MIASAAVEVNRRHFALPKGYPVNNTFEGARVDVMQMLIGGASGGSSGGDNISGLRVHGATQSYAPQPNEKVGGWRPPT
jgi:hypothetical protein